LHNEIDFSEVPTKAAWGDLNVDPELSYAYKNFGEKSRLEAEPKFARNVIERAGELRIMPGNVFSYYMMAFNDHINFGHYEVADAGDVFSCFIGVVESRLASEPEKIMSIMEVIMPTLHWIANSQDIFRVNREIYGNFSERVYKISDLIGYSGSSIESRE